MYINGTILTNSQPTIISICSIAKQRGIPTSANNQHIKLLIKTISFIREIKCTITTNATSVNYRCFVPELIGYLFVCLAAMLFLFRMFSFTLWITIFVAIIIIFFLVKIYFDHQIRRIVDSIIPQSVRLIPELAHKEHVEWINNPLVCSACGAAINKYSAKCISCGISLPNHEFIKSNTDHSGDKNKTIQYHYNTCEK